MNKIEQAGSGANQNPGMTSYTGNSVWARTQKNTPVNEEAIRQTPLRINAEVYGIIVRMAGQEAVDKTVNSGLLVVA